MHVNPSSAQLLMIGTYSIAPVVRSKAMTATSHRFANSVGSQELPMSEELLRRLRESGL